MKYLTKKFTLLELLIVVAIIGILLSILLPSLAQAREAAKRAVCISNTSQQVKLLLTFSVSNNGKTTLQFGTGKHRNNAYFKVNSRYHNFANLWRADLFPNDPTLLFCPSKPRSGPLPDLPMSQITDYSVRPEAYNGTWGPTNKIDENLTPIAPHAKSTIISENLYGGRYGKDYFPFHGEGNVTAYGDGHAKYIHDKGGTNFLLRLRTDRSNTNHRVQGNGWPLEAGVWGKLDNEF